MQTVFALLPLVAAFLAVPQFWPQLARVRRAWHYGWGVVVVGGADEREQRRLAGLLRAVRVLDRARARHLGGPPVGQLAVVLARRSGGLPKRPMSCWPRRGRWCCSPPPRRSAARDWARAWPSPSRSRSRRRCGRVHRFLYMACVSRGTWLLIFGELLCWGVFGIHEADPRLIVLGATGVLASLLVLARVSWPQPDRAPVTHLAIALVTAAAVTVLPVRPGHGRAFEMIR